MKKPKSDNSKAIKEFLAWLAADQMPCIIRAHPQFPELYKFCKAHGVTTVTSISKALYNTL